MAHMPSLSCSTRMKSARGCITSIISNRKGWVQEPLTTTTIVGGVMDVIYYLAVAVIVALLVWFIGNERTKRLVREKLKWNQIF